MDMPPAFDAHPGGADRGVGAETAAPSRKLLTIDNLVDQLQISKPTIYRLILKGDLPEPIKVGNLSRWRQADIDAAIDVMGSKAG